MTTFADVAEAWIASREHGSGSLGRIQFWVEQLGPIPIDKISDDQVDDALMSALLWAHEHRLSDSAKANVKAQIFGKIFTHTSSTQRQVADPNDDRAFQFIMGELDKIAHFRQTNGAQNTD